MRPGLGDPAEGETAEPRRRQAEYAFPQVPGPDRLDRGGSRRAGQAPGPPFGVGPTTRAT